MPRSLRLFPLWLFLTACGVGPVTEDGGPGPDGGTLDAGTTASVDAGPQTPADGGNLDGGNSPDGGTSTVTLADSSQASIIQFVNAKGYAGWKAEAAVHTSQGPHGKVRSFVNDALYQSLKSGNATHPAGSIAVKELYASDGTTLTGHALDVKDANGWVFWEGFLPQQNQYYYVGTQNFCASCHASGVDYVTVKASDFP